MPTKTDIKEWTDAPGGRPLPAWMRFLFAPRERSSTGKSRSRPGLPLGLEAGDLIVLACYSFVLIFAVMHHRGWADEAQALLLARDSTLRELLLLRLHYEGAPALWPLMMWVSTRLDLPFPGISWISAAAAFLGVYLLLRASPLPRVFRWLLPFTFFLEYQYAVIARPYALFPALLFALCVVFCSERPRPILFALVAGALANISLHAAILSGVFAAIYLAELFGLPRRLTNKVPLGHIAAAAALYCLCAALAIAVAYPAPDMSFVPTPGIMWAKAVFAPGGASPAQPASPATADLDPPLGNGEGTVSNPAPHPGKPSLMLRALGRPLGKKLLLSADAATFGIARSNLLAVATLSALLFWLWMRRSLYLALPFLFALLLSAQVWVFDHHTGQFFLSLVAAVWIAMRPSSPVRRAPSVAQWMDVTFTALALAVVLLQIGWTAHCIRSEAHSVYDPGEETAQLLSSRFAGKRVAGYSYESISTQAYAPANLFFNQRTAYWLWGDQNLIERHRTETLRQHPDAVVVGDLLDQREMVFNQWLIAVPPGRHHQLEMVGFWQQNGYQVTHKFCGDRFMRLGVTNTFCEYVLEPAPSVAARP